MLVRGSVGVQDRGDGLDLRRPNRDLHVLKQLLLQDHPGAQPSDLALPGRASRGRPQDHVWRPLDSAGESLPAIALRLRRETDVSASSCLGEWTSTTEGVT